MTSKKVFSILLLIFSFTLFAAEENNTHDFKLKNGLKLIVKEDHRAPIVVSQVWYKIGSSYEHNGITGVSHVVEHMMFKGTRKHPAGEFSRIISANGGRENAFTGRDYTAYFQQLEKSRLKVSFELEADRMRNLLLQDKEFQKEVQVVMEERRLRTEDEPQALTYEQFMATAYTSSPYRHPIIGWMDDLENMEADDLKKWYRLWYAPNNATVVVVGDVNADEVLKLAKKYFGKLKPSNLTPPKPQREPAQRGQKRITVKAPAELPYLLMGYKVPVINTTEEAWEPYALEVLAGVLDGGDSARFAKDLVRDKRIASSVSAGYSMTSRNSEVFLFDGTPTQDHTINQLEEAIKAQIKQLKEETVSDDELARIKAQVVASNVYELDSVFYQAMQIGMLETVGLDWRLLDQYVDRIKAVTAEQIKAVANKYLIDDHLTVAVLDPQPIDPKNMHRPMRRGGSHGH